MWFLNSLPAANADCFPSKILTLLFLVFWMQNGAGNTLHSILGFGWGLRHVLRNDSGSSYLIAIELIHTMLLSLFYR